MRGLRRHFTVDKVKSFERTFGIAYYWDQCLERFQPESVIHVDKTIYASQLAHTFEEHREVLIVEVVSIKVEFRCDVVEDGEGDF